jgi:enterochelin esterase-like enzyme
VGGGIVFCSGYLVGFLQSELRPTYDPGGNLESLDAGALLHTVCVMLALSMLCAFLGAAVGAALGEVLLDPPAQLLKLLLRRRKQNVLSVPRTKLTERPAPHVDGVRRMLRAWLCFGLAIIVLLLASGSSELLLYAPDIGLHRAPIVQEQRALPTKGTILQDSLVSPALGGQRRSFLVYLPPSYNTPQGSSQRYPTLYLLHGSPGHEQDWITAGLANQSADTLIAQGKIPELIMVFPDGNGRPGQTSEWGNSGDQRQLMETFVAVDLVKYVDAKYRTLAEPAWRGIGGLSMGGFGAMNIALHHPDVFGFVISLGGYYRAEGSIWGKNRAYLQANSPLDLLPHDPAAWGLHLYLGAATKDQPYYTDTLQFVQELRRLHLSYQLDIQPGYHSWKVWQVQLYHALLWLKWGAPPALPASRPAVAPGTPIARSRAD